VQFVTGKVLAAELVRNWRGVQTIPEFCLRMPALVRGVGADPSPYPLPYYKARDVFTRRLSLVRYTTFAERFSIFSKGGLIPLGGLACASLRWTDKQTEQKT